MSRCGHPRCLTSLRGYQRAWVSADLVAGLTLLVIAVPEQLATSRLAGMPPITGFYAFIAGTVLFAFLGSNPQMSVGADSTIAPLFAAGVTGLAALGSPHYIDLVGILAVMVGLLVMLVSILRLGWIAEFLSTPIVTGFLSGVAVIIVIHQLPDFLGLPEHGRHQRIPDRLRGHAPGRRQRRLRRHRRRGPRRDDRLVAGRPAHSRCAHRAGRLHRPRPTRWTCRRTASPCSAPSTLAPPTSGSPACRGPRCATWRRSRPSSRSSS